MGAYGSPDLFPNNDHLEYQRSQYENPYKPKNDKSGCLKNLLILFATFVVFFIVASVIYAYIPKSDNIKQVASYSTNIPSVLTSSPTASSALVAVDDSADYLQSWAKVAVLKALIYPDTAKFSDNPADWKFVRDGNMCEITSFVTARGKGSKQNFTSPFVVRISYNDVKADITYISINNKVCYDTTSSKTSKSK